MAPGGGRPRLLLLIPTTTYRAEAFVEAARRLDVDLTVASEHDSTFSATEPDKLLTLDFINPEYAAEQVKAFATEHPLAAVFGVDDKTVVVAAHASALMGLRHNSVVAAKSAGDKYRQRVLLWEKGVPVPEFRLFPLESHARHVAESVSYPCVLKPVNLTASRGVVRANNPSECEHAFERVREIVRQASGDAPGWATPGMVVEQYVSGPEYALEGWLQDGELHVLALFDKPDPLEGPYFAETIYVTPSRTSDAVQGKLTRCAESAARSLGLNTGPVHVELRYNDAGPWLIELAARPIGGKCGQVLRFGPHQDVSLEQLVLGRTLGRFNEMPTREQDAVAVMMIPVPRAGTLDRVDGVEAALGVPLVTDVIVTAHRGQELVPLPDDSCYIGFTFARGEVPEAVEQAVREASQLIEFVIT